MFLVTNSIKKMPHTFNLPHPGSARGKGMFVAIALFSVSVLVTSHVSF